jgi:hypothetical protein
VKPLTLRIFALAAVPGSAWQIQNVTGTWQGSLGPGPTRRIVMKITRADDESLKAVLHSIDQAGASINASSATQQGQL